MKRTLSFLSPLLLLTTGGCCRQSPQQTADAIQSQTTIFVREMAG